MVERFNRRLGDYLGRMPHNRTAYHRRFVDHEERDARLAHRNAAPGDRRTLPTRPALLRHRRCKLSMKAKKTRESAVFSSLLVVPPETFAR
jgi:hypothetical protein